MGRRVVVLFEWLGRKRLSLRGRAGSDGKSRWQQQKNNGGQSCSPDEEANGGDAREKKPAEVAQPALCVSLAALAAVDPYLLQLHGARRPRRGFRLEQDHSVFGPQPRAPFVDLGPCAPAETFRVPLERIDSDLLAVSGGPARPRASRFRPARAAGRGRRRAGRAGPRAARATMKMPPPRAPRLLPPRR